MDKEKIDKEKVGKLLKEVKKGRFKKARKIFNTLGYDEVILSAIMVSMEVEDGGSEFDEYIEKRIWDCFVSRIKKHHLHTIQYFSGSPLLLHINILL